jgi:hypothetical protein
LSKRHSCTGDRLHPSPFWSQVFNHYGSALSSTCLFGARFSAAKVPVCRRLAFLGPGFLPPRFRFVVDLPFWGQVFAKTQLCCRLAFLGPGFLPPRFRFIVDLPFWGQVFDRQGLALWSICLFGARFSAAKVPVCRRLAFLGPGFLPPRFRFIVGLPFWSQVFDRQGLALWSICLFGAKFSPRLSFVVYLPFWSQVRGRQG